MKKIVQLEETEYKTLSEQAAFNQSEIVRLARKMYEDRGTFAIVLDLDCDQDYQDNITIKAHSHVKDWEGKYPLSEKDKKEIVEFVNYRALKMMRKKFGRQIDNINLWNKRLDLLRNWKMKFIGWMIFGWLAAVTLLIIALIK